MTTANQADLVMKNIDWLITVDPHRRIIRDGRLMRIDQDEVMREVVKAGERITGRLNMKKVLKLRWPVQ